ncbi:MAG: tRNA (adenosine(37)-N6)-threonylcarbamoyltransferase complex dimerization subunit type 1 TsaB [Clostridia bacterium]|nr:tRNA (adenosine(37)-N6)-threonylcarbamoyltransferase complex dimerization subunit type 1 TsaB [Clostridia bacterium]MBR3681614.1 tRNA (adenosine(37)-N6)-threonylcarbamoyltransferase complex dimerization subunit type 1 TsaB [Clostridia bacterium]
MKILAFDSTARAASVAVLEDCRLLGQYNIDNGFTHSELLLPMAENLLKSLGMDISEIELFAAAVGPGSFTGVRIGAALVKGLAFGRDIPCVEVSTLRALAENLAGTEGYIISAMDARRAQVYTATFSSSGEEIKRLCEDRAMPISELSSELSRLKGEVYVVGDAYNSVYSALKRAGVNVKSTPPLSRGGSAYSIGRVAYGIYRAGGAVSDRELSPKYLRMPQAERERLEKLNKGEV